MKPAPRTSAAGALIKTGERREWRKKPHQPNEALDIVVGARALAWGEGAGQLTPRNGESGRPRRRRCARAAEVVLRAAGCAEGAGGYAFAADAAR